MVAAQSRDSALLTQQCLNFGFGHSFLDLLCIVESQFPQHSDVPAEPRERQNNAQTQVPRGIRSPAGQLGWYGGFSYRSSSARSFHTRPPDKSSLYALAARPRTSKINVASTTEPFQYRQK